MSGIRIPELPRGWPPRLPHLLPFYAAAWLANACTLLAIASVVGDERFRVFTLALLTAGFVTSLGLRLRQTPRGFLANTAPVVVVGMVALVLARDTGSLLPGLGMVSQSILPAIALTWFLILFSFYLVDDEPLLFTIPPCLAVLGLAGTENPNSDQVAYFIIFVVAAMLAVSYQHYLHHAPATAGEPRRGLALVLRWQVASMAVLFTLAAILTAALSVPLKRASVLNPRGIGVPPSSLLGSLGSLGPRRDDTLRVGQGPTSLSAREVMRVKSPRAAYWRCRTFDTYADGRWSDNAMTNSLDITLAKDGKGWEATLLTRRGRADSAEDEASLLRQEYQFVGNWPARALPLVPYPVRITMAERPARMRANHAGTVFVAGRYLPERFTYSVLSHPVQAAPRELRAIPAPETRGEYLSYYTRVPSSVWKLKPLVDQITEGRHNNFDRASAIAEYLTTHGTYNLRVRATPDREDPVTHFLLKSREGYCEIFASTMVVLCRLANIPARLATGFATGELDPQSGEYIVREMDAHAWVEVFFPGVGWVEFDPTPGGGESASAAAGRGLLWRLLPRLEIGASFPGLLLLGVLGLTLHLLRLTAYEPWRRHRALLHAVGDGPRGQILSAYYTATARLRRRVPRKSDQTPWEYLAAVAARAPKAPWLADLEALTRAFLAARYSRETATEAEAKACRERLGRILDGVKRQRWEKRGKR